MKRRSLSLRGRLLWIVVGGAILPMAMIGVWLSANTKRSARDLLVTELDSTLVAMKADVADRWSYRQGDLELLRRNEAVVRLLDGSTPDPSASAYLTGLKANLSGSVSSFVVRDRTNRVRLDSDTLTVAHPVQPGRTPADPRRAALVVQRNVESPAGAVIGTIEAYVPIAALISADRAQGIFHGASVQVTDARNRATLLSWTRPPAAAGRPILRSTTLDDPPLHIELAADDAPYVAPFEHAARIGLLSLVGVAALAFLLTSFLTARVTDSVGTMVDAAAAVAAGDLERRVPVNGEDDIARLATAFNSMTDGLRATLQTLSRQQSLVAVGEFAATLSHEVRNGLTSVRLDLQRVHERLTSDGANTVLVERSLTSMDRLNRIVTGSLRIARTDPAAMLGVSLEGVARAARAVSSAWRLARSPGLAPTLARSSSRS
jgi:HAMP domain-containing protein